MTDEAVPTVGLGIDDPGRERALLERIIGTVTAGLDLEELLQGVAAIITDATATDVCFVHLVDHDRRQLVLTGATPPFDQHAGSIELEIGQGVAGWVALHQEPAVVDDKFEDERYHYIPELRGEDYTSMVSVPMVSRPGGLVGVLNVHTRERRDFGEDDIATLESIAGLMAGAIENARLHRRLEVREHAREQFAERLIAAQEHERRRLAAEIHDGISQRIVGLSYRLTAAAGAVPDDPPFAMQQIDTARELAAAALEETRAAIAGLRPSVLDDLGLPAGLESLVRTLGGVTVEMDVQQCHLPDHVETALYRIAQEALQNINKHAEADNVAVRLVPRRRTVLLEVADDGRGFDPATTGGETRDGRVAYGLTGMRERADLIGARLTIDSAPGEGTTVSVRLPLNGTQGADAPPS